MRKSLESRIETLESAIMAGHRFDAIAITLVSPGNLSPDIDHNEFPRPKGRGMYPH